MKTSVLCIKAVLIATFFQRAWAVDEISPLADQQQQQLRDQNTEEHHPGESTAPIQERHNNDSIRYWIVEKYPNPENDQTACHTTSNRLCDPDSILKPEQAEEVANKLAFVRRSPTICKTEDTDAAIEIQFAIALANSVDLSVYGSFEDEVTKAAETFARYLHDHWGVGMESSCGGTGLLIFLSVRDRAIYISRGKAMERILTNSRVDRVIDHMKPLLKRGGFKDALINAIDELDDLLKSGEPNFSEKMQDFFYAYSGLVWVFSIFGFSMWSSRRQTMEQRNYAQVASHLDEIDRARALALQGQFKAVSCPICLEAFEKEEGEEDFSKGSDGQPIKLLRCGHVFDESCWEEWVSSGQGQVDKCPICKHDVGRRPADDGTHFTNENDQDLVEREASNGPSAEQRAIRQYNFERQFRLARLGTRFPRYIGSQQIQRWTQSTYDGPLARDPAFLQNNPSVRTTGGTGSGGSRGYSSSRSGGASFGGGSSAGGRGSTW
mmetsp:Transcript_5676/g.7459  ORF Transcript_5676/g.7459 Transcript_5676/m.7459 type:complete len:494 (-) Transcript_5676:1272-2753(-)